MSIAEAQGGIEGLVTWTNLSPQTLTYLLNTECPSQLDKMLDILFQVRCGCKPHLPGLGKPLKLDEKPKTK